VRICPNPRCKRENPDESDWCGVCGEYLRWEPTVVHRVVPGPAATPEEQAPAGSGEQATEAPPLTGEVLPVVRQAPLPTAQQPRLPDPVSLTLHGADGELLPPGVHVLVEPGQRMNVWARVRNQSGIVDSYEVRVDGIPAEWWTVSPKTVYLVPYGAASGNYEDKVEIAFHPPRTPDAEARDWPVRVVAFSRSHATETSKVSAVVQIGGYVEIDAEVRPARASGRMSAGYRLVVANRANAPVTVACDAADGEGACIFPFREPRLTIPPGQRGDTHFEARPSQRMWFGKATDHRFDVRALPSAPGATAPTEPTVRQATYRQRAVLPFWVPPVALLIAAGLVLLFVMFRGYRKVPDVRGKTLSGAVLAAQRAGFKCCTAHYIVVGKGHPHYGWVYDQSPRAGSHAKKGAQMSVGIAVPYKKGPVPNLVGLTGVQAEQSLNAHYLKIGNETPKPDDPNTATVVNQGYTAGQVVPDGTAIDLFFAKQPSTSSSTGSSSSTSSKSSTDTKSSTSTKSSTDTKSSTSKKGGTSTVPARLTDTMLNVGGASVNIARAKLAAKGITPSINRVMSGAPAGTVVRQDPAANAKLTANETVTLDVSLGEPQVAFDNGAGQLLFMDGADGGNRRAILQGGSADSEPAWNRNGSMIAFRRGDQAHGAIWVYDVKQQGARPLTADSGANDQRPAFSPNGKVVAFEQGTPTAAGGMDYDLCFVHVQASTPSASSCIRDPSTNVTHPTWSPDGKAIFVLENTPTQQQVTLLRYTTSKADTGEQSNWTKDGKPLAKLQPANAASGNVMGLAWSPAKPLRLAFTATWDGTTHLYIADAVGHRLTKLQSYRRLLGCDPAWRIDGGELLLSPCQSGSVIRVNPDDAAHPTTLAGAGYDAAWSPVVPTLAAVKR
jgi:beta-lactam-binding protein with PASTA domain